MGIWRCGKQWTLPVKGDVFSRGFGELEIKAGEDGVDGQVEFCPCETVIDLNISKVYLNENRKGFLNKKNHGITPFKPLCTNRLANIFVMRGTYLIPAQLRVPLEKLTKYRSSCCRFFSPIQR